MRILIWPAGDENDATSQYRLLLPARVLQAQGADVKISRDAVIVIRDEAIETTDGGPENLIGVYPPNADVVVMQRPARRDWADIIPHIQSYGIKVVVDVDDRFDRIHRDHVGRANYDPRLTQAHNYEHVDMACKLADLVTVTTPALLGRYGHGHGVVLPNYVPERYLKIRSLRTASVGWTGNAGTHAGDLDVAGPGIGRITTAHGWAGHVVGSAIGVGEKLGFSKLTASGWLPFDLYPKEMSYFGVGLVPLADTQFNRSKSGLKMSEFASLGVPVIASATPDNKRMHAHGIGLLAQSPADFERHLTALLRDVPMREDLGTQGREAMAAFTVEANAWRWLEAWESAATKPLRKAA